MLSRFRSSFERGSHIYPWLLASIILAAGLFNVVITFPIVQVSPDFWLYLASSLGYQFLLPAMFAALGALIITRQSGHKEGWLMMLAALGFANPAASLVAALELSHGAHISTGQVLLVWFSDWTWMVPIVACLLIALNFPDGRPPSPRWNWIGWLTAGLLLGNAFISVFYLWLGPDRVNALRQQNPSGIISILAIGVDLVLILVTALAAGGSIFSLVVRFRRGSQMERAQIKWLLFAGALFIVSFFLIFAVGEPEGGASWLTLLLIISFSLIPLAIAIAILRYRLWDINFIIRNTLLYALLTGTLAAVYFLLVILLQRLLPIQNQLSIVLSTLVIAALFSPLRRRIQNDIDRLFFRRRYDSEQALNAFSALARDEVDLEHLNEALMEAIEETIQPAFVQVWLHEAGKSPENFWG